MLRFRVPSLVLPLAILALLTLFSSLAFAQYGASITGTVTDTKGAVVQSAEVTVTNQATGVSQTVVTDDSGIYRVAQLPPGNYTVSVTSGAFQKSETKDVVVSAERPTGFNVKLLAGGATQTVTVTAGTEQLDTETANNQSTITTLEVTELPQFGRDPYNLVRTTPGVFGEGARNGAGNTVNLPNQAGPGGSNTEIFQVENQIQALANGQRVNANNITLDGVSVNSLDWGGAAVITPGQESVAEMTIVASSYSAEDGRNSGISVKAVSKNGTNRLHGSGVIKFNDKGLNAFNKFYGPTNVTLNPIKCEGGTFTITAATCPSRVDQKYRQFAGSLGGPIIKDRLFFFFSYEGVRNNSNTLARSVTLETPQFDQYIVSKNPNSIAAKIVQTPGYAPRIVNTISTKDCCSLDGRPLRSWYQPGTGIGQAIGNGPDGIPDWGVFDINQPSTIDGNQFNGRVDFNAGKNQFFASSYFVNRNDLQGGLRPLEDLTFQPNNWIGTIGWIRTISNSMVNDLRGNFTRYAYDQVTPTGTTNYGIPFIELFDFDAGGLGNLQNIGVPAASTTPAAFAQNTFSLRDTVSWMHGRHAFKMGVDVIKEQNNNNLNGNSRPTYQFRGLLNFANDACCFFEGVGVNPLTGGPANELRHFRTSDYALFIDDTWKLRSNLTVTLGLRWEYFPPFEEKDGLLSNYIFGSQGRLNGTVQQVSQLSNPDKNNFGPKIGFAWAPYADGATVIRGGVGLSYNRDFGVVFSNNRQNTPFAAQVSDCCFFDPGPINGPPPGSGIVYEIGTSTSAFSYAPNPNFAFGVAPDGALCSNVACTAITPIDIFGSPQNQPNPYVVSYSLEVEQGFGKRDTLRVGYYGSQSRKLLQTIDLNRSVPGDVSTCPVYLNGTSTAGCPATVIAKNPRFNRIFFPEPNVNANYNALVTSFAHKYGYGLTFNVNYTWSHSIDTSSNDIGFQATDPSNPAIDKGNSDFDVRHNFVVSGVWETPFYKGRHDLLGQALGGWVFSTVLTRHSGFPFSALVGSCDPARDLNGDGYCPDLPHSYSGGMIVSPTSQQWINGVFPSPLTEFNVSTRGTGCQCRNMFAGPGYADLDLTFGKNFGMPSLGVFGEAAKLELRANVFNFLNTLNLSNFVPATAQTDIFNSTGPFPQFGHANNAYAGRVVELQARFSF